MPGMLALLLVLLFPGIAAAQSTLFLSPSAGPYEVGVPFTVVVSAAAGAYELDAAEGELRYDTNDLVLESIAVSDSLVATWATPPTDETGLVRFSGWFASRYAGTAGPIFTLRFRPQRIATGEIRFLSGTLLSSQVQHTNVLEELRGMQYSVQPYTAPPAVPSVPIPASVPPAEVGTSTPASQAAVSITEEPQTVPLPTATDVQPVQAAASAAAAKTDMAMTAFISALVAFLAGFGIFRVVRG